MGFDEAKFTTYMSLTRVNRHEIPTQKRNVLRNLGASHSAAGVVHSSKGVLKLSNSMNALRDERSFGLSLTEIKKSTEFALKTVVDPMVAHREREQEQEHIRRNLQHSEADFDGGIVSIPWVGGMAAPHASSNQGSHQRNSYATNLEHEIFEELKERQKSREMDGQLSRERSQQKSRRDNRHRSSTPIDIAHTRMSLKAVNEPQKKTRFVNIQADFANPKRLMSMSNPTTKISKRLPQQEQEKDLMPRSDFDFHGENAIFAKGGKGW